MGTENSSEHCGNTATEIEPGFSTRGSTLNRNRRIFMCDRKRQRKQTAAVGILVLMAAFGIAIDESDFLGGSHTGVIQYLEVYSAFLPLLVYIVPFCLFMRHIALNYQIQRTELIVSAFCGALIPAAFAGNMNDAIGDFLSKRMGQAYSDAWIGSLEAGIVEELLKLGTAALLLYVFGRRMMKHFLCVGMCVGIGFQIEEDLSYITQNGFEDVNQAFPTALDRISGAPGSHWVYTAVAAYGLYRILRNDGKNHRRNGVLLIIFVIADHFLYDSPVGDALLGNALLTAAVVFPVIVLLKSPMMRDEDPPHHENVEK